MVDKMDVLLEIKDLLISRGGEDLHTNNTVCLWAVKMPPKTIKNVKWANIFGRIRHLFSQTRIIPYIPHRKGTFVSTMICLQDGSLLSSMKEVNPDGSEIQPKIEFGTLVPRYSTMGGVVR